MVAMWWLMSIDLTDPELLQQGDIYDGCFLCEPEGWRIIYDDGEFRVVAGLGPLAPGYVLVSPVEHVASMADLPARSLHRLDAIVKVMSRAYSRQYQDGFTAYEHGRVGSCGLVDPSEVHYCNHAHLVMIPVAVPPALGRAARAFRREIPVSGVADIGVVSAQEYVFVQVEDRSSQVAKIVLETDGIPSHFMRRHIAALIADGRSWNWAQDLGLEEVIDTVARLRGEFIGLVPPELPEIPTFTLGSTLTLDGLAGVGKSTIGQYLSKLCGRPYIESGMYFRGLAYARINDLTHDQVPWRLWMLGIEAPPKSAKSRKVSLLAAEFAKSDQERERFYAEMKPLVSQHHPCLIGGRDAWQLAGTGPHHHVILVASDETRCRRRLLQRSGRTTSITTWSDVSSELQRLDEVDSRLLPGKRDAHVVDNGRVPLASTARRLINLATDPKK